MQSPFLNVYNRHFLLLFGIIFLLSRLFIWCHLLIVICNLEPSIRQDSRQMILETSFYRRCLKLC